MRMYDQELKDHVVKLVLEEGKTRTCVAESRLSLMGTSPDGFRTIGKRRVEDRRTGLCHTE